MSNTAQVNEETEDAEDRMMKITALISRLQETKDSWGDTCVYIRRGGLSWGAVALNRQSDDKKHGVFDLQAQHDRDMLERLGQIERLKASRDRAEKLSADSSAALKIALGHIEHMSVWITKQNAGYSFESLGEDIHGIRAAAGELP